MSSGLLRQPRVPTIGPQIWSSLPRRLPSAGVPSAWVPEPRYLAQLPIACRARLPFNFVWGPRAGIIGFFEYADAYTRNYFAKHADFHGVCKVSNVCYENWGHLFGCLWPWALFFLMFFGICRHTTQTYYAKNSSFHFLIRFVLLLEVAQQVFARGKNCQKGFAKFPRYVTKIGRHLFCCLWTWEFFLFDVLLNLQTYHPDLLCPK